MLVSMFKDRQNWQLGICWDYSHVGDLLLWAGSWVKNTGDEAHTGASACRSLVPPCFLPRHSCLILSMIQKNQGGHQVNGGNSCKLLLYLFLAEGLGLRGSLRHYKGQFCPPLVAQPRYFLCCISCCYIGHSWGFCAAGYPWSETVRLSTGLGQYFPIFIMSWQT